MTVDADNVVSPAGKLLLDPMRRFEIRRYKGKTYKTDTGLGWIYDDDPEHLDLEITAEKVSKKSEQGMSIDLEIP